MNTSGSTFAGALTRTRSSGAVRACASVRAHRAECASRKKSPTLTGAVFVLTAQALELLQENAYWYGETVSGGLLVAQQASPKRSATASWP
jgi:hypothetical protein